MSGTDDVRTEPSITLHSSWFGIVSATLGGVILLAIAVVLLVANGLSIGTGIFAVVAVGAAAVLLYDMPLATRFEAGVIERLTPLRRRRIATDRYDRFTRMRKAIRRPGSGATSGSTGLIAVRGRRQTMLVDRMEGRAEHEELRRVLGELEAERLMSDVHPPPMSRTPTWSGRRKRWHPDDGD